MTMFTLSITVPQDVLDAGNGSVAVAMYGQLAAPYAQFVIGQYAQFDVNQWVYYTGSGYAPIGTSVPPFTTFTSAGTTTWTLPAEAYLSGAFIFGVGSLPTIPVLDTAPSEPIPTTVSTTYDVVELTYDIGGSLYVNTTAVDQFGIPIQIQLDPPNANLPDGAGVFAAQTAVLSGFPEYAGPSSPFLQCGQDLFGHALTTGLVSTGYMLTGNCVQGVQANPSGGPPSTLPPGTYAYAVTALDSGGNESNAQPGVAIAQTGPQSGLAVTVAWSASNQPAGIASYNIYRGTVSDGSVSWDGLLTNVPADAITGFDTGQALLNDDAPPLNPLATYFDDQVAALFASSSITLTATDGSTDGYVYTLAGGSATDSGTGNPVLQFLVTATDPNGTADSSPPIPLQTVFNVFSPFWSTNTYDSSNPAPPPWVTGASQQEPASLMVFNNNGVFADNTSQPVPGSIPAKLYQTVLGSVENQLVSALMRGIAGSSITPVNWGNGTAPIQTAPSLTTAPGSLTPGTTYYYVITAVNAGGETVESLEFNATPATATPSVQVNWLPFQVGQASSFNVYRGTASQQENTLVASVPNDGSTSSYVDSGAAGTSQTPPSYYPAGGVWDAYSAYLHQPAVSLNGAAYAFSFDDQGGESTTLSDAAPLSLSITLGPWS
jgi:hypothetical protein